MFQRNLNLNIKMFTDLNSEQNGNNAQGVQQTQAELSDTEKTARLNQIINNIQRGNITFNEDIISELRTLGITPSLTTQGLRTVYKFEFKNKQYTINRAPGSVTSQGKYVPTQRIRDSLLWVSVDQYLLQDRHNTTLEISQIVQPDGTQSANGTTDTNSVGDDSPTNSSSSPLQDFEEKIKNNELDFENYSRDYYIEVYSELIRADLKEKYNYPDEYISLLLEFSLKNAKQGRPPESFLACFGQNYKELLLPPDLHSYYLYNDDKHDLYENGIDLEAMESTLFRSTSRSSNLQTQFFAHIFNDLLQEYTMDEREGIYVLLAKNMNLYDYENNQAHFNLSDFANLNTNGDDTWFDELYSKIKEIVSSIKQIPQSEIDNATSINPDILFKDTDSITAEYLLEHLNELLLSEDPGIRKLAQILKDRSENSITKKFFTNNDDLASNRINKQQILSGILYRLNEVVLGFSNTKTPTINRLLLDVLNTDFNGVSLFPSIYEIIDDILSSDELLDSIIIANIDGNIDEVDQGQTGDCWLLSGIRALVSTQTGKDIVKNAIQWADDKKSVWVYFAGKQQYVQITLDDIKNALHKEDGQAYSRGDFDVLVMELATQKLMGGYGQIEGGSSRNFWEIFLGLKNTDWDMGMGHDDILNTIWGFFTGHGGRQDMSSSDIYNFISKLYQAQQQGNNFAATCWLYTFNDSSYPFTDINGESHTLSLGGAGGVFNTGSGHEYSILEITATTITFANPHDSEKKQYTVTWEEFANLGFGGVECAIFNPPRNNEIVKIHNTETIIYSIDSAGNITTNTPVSNYDVPLIRNVSCNLDDLSTISSMLGGIKIAIKDKLNIIMNAFSGQYDDVKLKQAYDTLLDYYDNLLSAVVIDRSNRRDATGSFPMLYKHANGTTNRFAYHDYTKGGELVSSLDDVWLSNCSDMDLVINQPYGWRTIQTSNSSGVFVNEYNGRFDIYVDLQTMVNKFKGLLS